MKIGLLEKEASELAHGDEMCCCIGYVQSTHHDVGMQENDLCDDTILCSFKRHSRMF